MRCQGHTHDVFSKVNFTKNKSSAQQKRRTAAEKYEADSSSARTDPIATTVHTIIKLWPTVSRSTILAHWHSFLSLLFVAQYFNERTETNDNVYYRRLVKERAQTHRSLYSQHSGPLFGRMECVDCWTVSIALPPHYHTHQNVFEFILSRGSAAVRFFLNN